MARTRFGAAVDFRILCAIAACFLIGATTSGCSLQEPTYVTREKMQVFEETRHIEMPTAEVTGDALKAVAHDYEFNGGGVVDVTVTYNPRDPKNSASRAGENAARIARMLDAESIDNVKTEILPLHGSGVSKTHISFSSYRAEAAPGCTNILDDDDSDPSSLREYRLGCTQQDFLAMQISKPRDLLGREGEVETDGRKTVNTVSGYRWGSSLSDDVEAESTTE